MIRPEIRGDPFHRHAAETVVDAEGDDQDAHVTLQRRLETVERVARRCARDAGVHDFEREAGAADSLVEEGRIGRGGTDPVP